MRRRSSSPRLAGQRGFTLIELIMVIVLLGILAAVALPKYQDLREEAAEAACDGVFGAAQGAAAVNFAARLVSPSKATKIINGTTLIGAMQGVPAGWSSNGGATDDVLYKDFAVKHCSIDIANVETTTTMAEIVKQFN